MPFDPRPSALGRYCEFELQRSGRRRGAPRPLGQDAAIMARITQTIRFSTSQDDPRLFDAATGNQA